MAPSVSQTDPMAREVPPSSHYPTSPSSININVIPKIEPSQTHESTADTITYLFPDFKALQEICDKSQKYETVNVTGFEIYIVEQWACERRYATIITSYTGDSTHKIQAGKVQLPLDTSKWSDKFVRFFQEISETGAQPKKTQHGFLFITNLSSFPSNLNLLPVPCGCLLNVWQEFIVNLDLRRMHCGGRSALLLCEPSDACGDKFRQIYKTHAKVDIMYAVKELVTLVQICLVDFKLLDPRFVDGLLCNYTVEKIKEWWTSFGSFYYGTTPSDGVLGPTTVSAIIGFVLSCYFRLDIAGADFPKEPFNYFSFRVTVGKFQKQYNLTRTWYLDQPTVSKLFKVTSKISNKDISKLKKVVKSRVQDISGKGSSIQYAPEVLTTDLVKLKKSFNCSGRLSYLWNGKGQICDLKGFDYNDQLACQTSSVPKSSVQMLKNLRRDKENDVKKLKVRSTEEENTLQHYSEESPTREAQLQAKKGPLGQCVRDVNADIDIKKKPTGFENTNKTFTTCLYRRNSFPYLRGDIGYSQMTYENHDVGLLSTQENVRTLRRSKSLSFIESSISEIDPIPSVPFISQQVKDINLKWIKRVKESKIYEIKRKNYTGVIKKSQNELSKLKQFVKPLSKLYEFEMQSNDRALGKMQDIQTIGARLEYEMRILSTKVRDTQDSVEQFSLKVDSLYTYLKQSNSCLYDVLIGDSDARGSEGFCWYSIITRIDLDRLKSMWERFDPSFGYARWISTKFFGKGSSCISDKEQPSLPEITSRKLKEATLNATTLISEKAKQS